jgi:death-on-curing protein
MHSIISNHVFNDGNKRTGLESAIIFLRLNGHRLDYDLTHDEIYNITIRVASGELSLKETQEWFKANIIKY